MRVIAKENFSGTKLSMCVGEVADVADDNIVKDLLRAGYIEEINPADKGDAKEKETKKRGAK